MNLFVALSLILHSTGGSSSCSSFHAKTTRVANSHGCNATLTFSVDNRCPDPENDVSYVKVFKGTSSLAPPECVFKLKNNKCKSPVGCRCDNQLGLFYITRQLQEGETWLIVGKLRKGGEFNTTVYVHSHDSTELSYSSQTVTKSTNAATTSPSTSTSTPVTTPNQPPERQLLIILGSSGCALLFAVGLAIVFHAVMRKRKVGGRSGRLPPPPAPHNVRRATGEGVIFRVQPPPPFDRDSLVSVQVNDYAEIPGDTDKSSSNKSLTTLDSSPVLDSSMSDDCLHHIACPSSDSSLPEDYLHPVVSASEGAIHAMEASSFTKARKSTGYPPVRGEKLSKESRPNQM